MKKNTVKYDLSIIVACFNSEATIRRCILSFIEQKSFVSNVRLIIIDDGSTDNYFNEIIDVLENDNVELIKQSNGGVSSARNVALDIACKDSSYVSFLDADDFLDLNYIREFDHAIESCIPDIIEFNITRLNDNKSTYTINTIVNEGFYILEPHSYEVLSDKGYWFACSRIYSVDLFSDLRFELNRRFEDVLLIPLLYSKAKSCFGINKALYVYADNDNAFTNNVNTKAVLDFIYFTEKLDTPPYQKFNVCKMKSKSKKSIYLYMGRLKFNDLISIRRQIQDFFKVYFFTLILIYISSVFRDKIKSIYLFFRNKF